MPTANDSSASSDRLSYGDGHDDDGRRLERLEPLLSDSTAGEADERLLGQRHQLDAHQHQRRVAAVLHVAAEVLDQLLAALARIDAPAVERDRAVQAMAAAEHRRRDRPGAGGSSATLVAAARFGRFSASSPRLGGPVSLARVRLRLRQIDAAADRLLLDARGSRSAS